MTTQALTLFPAVRGRLCAVFAAVVLAAAWPAAAEEPGAGAPGGFSGEQVEGIETIVRDYLLEHPEVLVEALSEFQRRQKVAEEESRQQAIRGQRQALDHDPGSPVLGNPDGDVVMVEFFDYRCPYCRQVAEAVRKTVEDDGRIRLVMKEYPILGPESVRAARAALAAAEQGKYEEFHFALMTEPGDMSEGHLRKVAGRLGLDVARLERDMQGKAIDETLRRNLELAQALDIRGTPAFVIGNTLVPGAVDEAALRQLVAQTRAQQGS